MKTLHSVSILLLSICLILFSSCKKDKNLITITGSVTDASGAALAGVAVTDSNSHTATTDAQGNYSISADKAGVLYFVKADYTTHSENVSSRTTINVTLAVAPSKIFGDYFATAHNTVTDPAFSSNTLKPTGSLGTLAAYPSGSFFSNVNYKGAVDPTAATAWYEGWSFYDNIINGNTNSDALPSRPTKTINDAWMLAAGNTVNWTKDTTYILNDFVFVADGQELHIEAGTIVQGAAGTGANASALIVQRGGKIFAEGTSAEPIIFTYQGDAGNTPATTNGQWGGLILLGKARLNSNPGQTIIEGIPTTETRAFYGGTDDSDNSGILRYVSIRHGGSNIGADNEINGLTLGAIGSGTTIDYVEIVGNFDDGIECFGGTANIKHLISVYYGDDGFDTDEGFRGNVQFVIVHENPAANGDRGGEHDGGTNPVTATPYGMPIFYNCTYIGATGKNTAIFRDNAAGGYFNSIFSGFGSGIQVEDVQGQDQDSYKQFTDGNLKFENNVFFNIAAGTTGDKIFTISKK